MKMIIPYMDLRILDEKMREGYLRRFERICQHGRWILGPEVEELEKEMALFCRRSFGIGVSSGSDALYLALQAMNLEEGDEVITTALSWYATGHAIVCAGGYPVFCDVQDDLNIDPASIRRMISSRTRAIIVVHFMGRACDMDEIMLIAREHGIAVIEDCAQSFGATYKGVPTGNWGIMSCFSLNPMKIFGGIGEGGMILCDDEKLQEELKIRRSTGIKNKKEAQYVNLNHRIDTVHAAYLLEKLLHIGPIIKRRQCIARIYSKKLSNLFITPFSSSDREDIFYGYTLRVIKREEFMVYMQTHGIECKIQHVPLMPEQKTLNACRCDNLVNASILAREIVNIPNHEKLADEEVAFIVETARSYLEK